MQAGIFLASPSHSNRHFPISIITPMSPCRQTFQSSTMPSAVTQHNAAGTKLEYGCHEMHQKHCLGICTWSVQHTANLNIGPYRPSNDKKRKCQTICQHNAAPICERRLLRLKVPRICPLVLLIRLMKMNIEHWWNNVESGKTTYWDLRTETNLNYTERFTRSEHSVSAISKQPVHVLYGQSLSVGLLRATYIHCEGRIQHTWVLHLVVNIVTTMLKGLTAYNKCILTQTVMLFFCVTHKRKFASDKTHSFVCVRGGSLFVTNNRRSVASWWPLPTGNQTSVFISTLLISFKVSKQKVLQIVCVQAAGRIYSCMNWSAVCISSFHNFIHK